VSQGLVAQVNGVFEQTFLASASGPIEIRARFATTTATVSDISVREIPGNHASQATTGYKPVLKQDANGCYYLKFDGSDDFLVTGNVDFSASDKIAVAAGVRKLSDTTAGVIAETSILAASNNGAFGIFGPTGAGVPRFGCTFRGTVAVSANAVGFAAPVSAVISAIDVIGSDDLKFLANGVQVSYSTSDQGTGNFGNYPLYIGRRGGTVFPFNGHLYGLYIGGGMSNLEQLKIVEKYLGNKTGIQL
jgi:hypothetical protein